MTSVADHVDHDVLVELLAVLERQSGDPDTGFRIVAVHMEDRGLDHLGHVGGVLRRTGCGRRRGETDLVVDHDVHAAADSIPADLRQVEGLGDDTLTGERCVAVQQQRQDRVGLELGAVPTDLVHPGPDHAEHHRVDRFEMRRVRGQFERKLVAVAGDERAGLPEVVFHVARTHGHGADVAALELVEQRAVVLADDVDEHVEAAAVGHADHGLGHAGVRCCAEQGIDQRDRGFGAFDTEALLADVLRAEEGLQRLSGVEPSEDVALFVGFDGAVGTLELLLHPALLDRILDVHVLHTDGAAVRVAKDTEQIAEWHAVLPADLGIDARVGAGEELAIEIPDGEPVGRRVELRVHLGFFHLQRIEIRDQVAAHTVHVDQLVDLGLLLKQAGLPVERVDVAAPLDRFVWHVERTEDVDVEVVLAEE